MHRLLSQKQGHVISLHQPIRDQSFGAQSQNRSGDLRKIAKYGDFDTPEAAIWCKIMKYGNFDTLEVAILC